MNTRDFFIRIFSLEFNLFEFCCHKKQTFEDAEKRKREDEIVVRKADPLSQLVITFCRGAMTERSGALQEDPLYMAYAQIVAKSCGEEREDDEAGEGESSIHVCICSTFNGL